MSKNQRKLFSLTREDFKWDTYCCGGNGGQHLNATKAGVRCTHPPSGAVGASCETRTQHENRQLAFKKCVTSKEFEIWHRLETARRLAGEVSIEALVESAVNKAMSPHNLKLEVKDSPNGKWEEVQV